MRLILIRHAASRHARQGIIADLAGCTGLTADGRAQAQTLAGRLATMVEVRDCAALLTSPVPRARQTAALLLPALPLGRIEEHGGLREILPGAADGLSRSAYAARYGTFDLLAEPERPFAPGGESWSAFLARVRATLDDMAARFAGRTVVAVSHAGFIVAAMLVLLAIPAVGDRAQLEPTHTGLTEWRCAGGRWQLARYNDTGHLANAH